MIGPTMALDAVSAAAYERSYPALSIMRISMEPGPAASASAEPEMPEKKVSDTTLV